MVKRFGYLLLSVLLLNMSLLPAHAQDGTRVEQGAAFLAANNIFPPAYAELSTALTTNDYRQVSAVLAKYGYSPEQLKAFITEPNLLALRSTLNPGPSDALLAQALTVMQTYGLGALDMQTIAPLVNDPAALQASLLEKGLSAEQAGALLGQLMLLLDDAATQGWMPYYPVNGLLFTFIADAGLPLAMLYDSAYLLDDPAAAAAYLAGVGFSDEQVQTFVGLIPDMVAQGVTPDVLEGWTVRSMIYRLEGIGLSPRSIYEVVSLGNIDVVRGYLIAKGLSGDVLELALVNIGGCMGSRGEALSPERLIAFQVREARALLASATLAPADLRIVLSSDPAALGEYLSAAYTWDEAQIAAFSAALRQSTFAQTVDPGAPDAFIASVEAG